MKKYKIQVLIDGMMCNHCASKVKEKLLENSDISKVKIDLKKKCAILYSPKEISEKVIIDKIQELDYKVLKVEDL